MSVFVEQDETAGAFAAVREELHGGLGGARGRGAGRPEKIGGGFGHDHAHDGFAVLFVGVGEADGCVRRK